MRWIFGVLWWSLLLAHSNETPQEKILETSRLLEISQSQRTIRLNLGLMDRVEVGEFANLLLRNSEDKYVLVALAECLRVHTNSSIWRIQTHYLNNVLKQDQRVAVLRESIDLQGVRPSVVQKKKVIHSTDQQSSVSELLETYSRGYPKKIVQRQDQYYVIRDLKKTVYPVAQDVDLIDHQQWVKISAEESSSLDVEDQSLALAEDLLATPSIERVEVELNLDDLDQLTASQMEKVNDPNFSIEKIDRDQQVIHDPRFVRVRKTTPNLYERWAEEKPSELSTFAQEKMKREGDTWSSGYNDRELENFVINHGVQSERLRQEEVIFQSTDLELSIEGQLNLLSNRNDTDDENDAGPSSGFALGFEMPLVKFSDKFETYSIKGSLGIAQAVEDMEGRNVYHQTSSMGLQLRWHFKNLPSTLKKPIYYAGIGFQVGKSSASHPFLLPEVMNYRYYELPNLEMGVKYRLPKKLGASVSRWGWTFHGFARLVRKYYQADANEFGQYLNEIENYSFQLGAGIGVNF